MKASRRTLIAVVLLIVTLGQIASVQAAGDWRFGVVEAYEAPISAWDLGVTWTRVRFQWSEVQADGPDAWAPEVSDELIEQELAAGRTVVGLLIGIPDWARDANKLPMGLSLPPDDPDNTWASFVREAVTRYDGRINHWIIWNEPDIDPTAIAHTWDGSVDDFYQLQRTAYLVAKAANPSAVIHLAAFTYWADVNAGREQYMARLLDRILQDPDAAANQYYFDIATAHLYFQPDQIYDLVRFFIGLMEERGMRKPLWLVETNAPPADDPDWQVDDWTLYVTQNEQAAFIPQGLAAALAAGAERVAIYKLQDTADDRAANPEPFGLVRTDGSRRPAFRTYKTAVAYMSGAFHIERERWDEVGQFRLDQADRTTTVLFARLPQSQTVRVPAQSATARLVNMWGEIEVVAAEGGAFQVELPGALCIQTIGDYCMIGGTTYYLVQALEGGEPPDFAPPTLPPPSITPTPAPTLTPTPTATPTQTPSPTATPLPSATPTAASTSTATPTPEVLAGERAGEAGGTAVPINPNSSQNSTAQTLPGGHIILGGAALLAVGLGGWRFVRRRRYQQGSKRRSR